MEFDSTKFLVYIPYIYFRVKARERKIMGKIWLMNKYNSKCKTSIEIVSQPQTPQ